MEMPSIIFHPKNYLPGEWLMSRQVFLTMLHGGWIFMVGERDLINWESLTLFFLVQ